MRAPWYALQSRPKKEQAAATRLAAAGLEVYLPELRVDAPPGKAPAQEPLFPGYLFARLDPLAGDLRLATYSSGIARVVGYGEHPCPVPDGLVRSIRQRLAATAGRLPSPEYHRGERVAIAAGPLKDTEAIFDARLSAMGRAHVLIRILDRLCRAEVNVRQLRRVAQAATVA